MSTYIIPSDKRIYSIDCTQPPALTLSPPCTVTFITDDSPYERLSKGEDVDWSGFNSVTGPLYILGAERGDALMVEIVDIEMTRAWCVWENDRSCNGVLGDKTDESRVHELRLEEGKAVFSERMRVPLRPMIGCIATAPPEKHNPSETLAPTYPWGGNMDLRELSAGATMWLPVQVRGGLLYIGDLHGDMGVGEPALVGLEGAGRATVKVSLVKGMRDLEMPRLRVGNETLFMGLHRTNYRTAKQMAIDRAYEYLVQERKLEPEEAFLFVASRVDIRFGGPAGTIVFAAVPDPEPFFDS
eukprot:comp6193_c0_seq1/m.2028 comp6193_c0_seq1/g.2028  ORF comp6193_c0_seq1/g.2028 comp6193_c0_seq1/m.2028 type:complete len:299 (-) comp6193_c0_seq1:711-1607(-)